MTHVRGNADSPAPTSAPDRFAAIRPLATPCTVERCTRRRGMCSDSVRHRDPVPSTLDPHNDPGALGGTFSSSRRYKRTRTFAVRSEDESAYGKYTRVNGRRVRVGRETAPGLVVPHVRLPQPLTTRAIRSGRASNAEAAAANR